MLPKNNGNLEFFFLSLHDTSHLVSEAVEPRNSLKFA